MWNEKRSPMSSVTFATVASALRTSSSAAGWPSSDSRSGRARSGPGATSAHQGPEAVEESPLPLDPAVAPLASSAAGPMNRT